MIGKYLSRVTSGVFRGVRCVLLFVLCASILSGCFFTLAFAGRGDWSIPINEHYTITRPNGSQIRLHYTMDEPYHMSDYLIDNYYICAFFVEDHSLYLSGISTADKYITDAERESTEYNYCIVDMSTNTVSGPMNAEEFENLCTVSGVDPSGKWIPATYETAEAFADKKTERP